MLRKFQNIITIPLDTRWTVDIGSCFGGVLGLWIFIFVAGRIDIFGLLTKNRGIGTDADSDLMFKNTLI